MSVKNEIKRFLQGSLKELTTKPRDIELILYYYGFNDDPWPTLDEAAIKFDVGSSNNRRSERPRQIIKKKFLKNFDLKKLPLLNAFSNFINQHDFHSPSEIIQFSTSNKLFDKNYNFASLIRLLHDVGQLKDFDLYSTELEEVKKSTFEITNDFYISKKLHVQNLRKALKKSKVIPGLLGIAKLEYLKDDPVTRDFSYDMLVELLKLNSDSWFYEYNGVEYYLLESSENSLINSLQKIYSLTSLEKLKTLTEVLKNSLNQRTPPRGKQYPPREVIEHYLISSKFTEIKDNLVHLKIEAGNLTEIEKEIVLFMKNRDTVDYQTLLQYLLGLGFHKPSIDKNIFYSPLLLVDRTMGRKLYSYSLVGKHSYLYTHISDRYELYRQMLLDASSEGTDESRLAKTRKER